MPSESGSDGISDFSLAQRFEVFQIGGIPGSILTAPIARHMIKKPTACINTRPAKLNCALRSLQPIKHKLSNSMVNAQRETGLTKVEEDTRMAADWVVLPLRIISMLASSSGKYTSTTNATLTTGWQIANSIG